VNGEHLGEGAELYALGALDPAELQAAEAHLAGCGECRARAADAESVAAALASALPAYQPSAALRRRLLAGMPGRALRGVPSAPRWAMAAAAVFALGFGLAGWQDLALQSQRSQSDAALTAIVHGHFNHATLKKARPSSPGAKVLYARDGTWLYAIVDRPVRGMRLIARDATGGSRDLGTFGSDGRLSTLFVRDPGPIATIEIRDEAATEGSARISPGG
jgi:hypothetical protein